MRSLMGAMDAINEKHGRSVVRCGLGSLSRTWKSLKTDAARATRGAGKWCNKGWRTMSFIDFLLVIPQA